MSIFHIVLLILSTLPLLREAFHITGQVIDCPKLKGRVIRFIMEVEKIASLFFNRPVLEIDIRQLLLIFLNMMGIYSRGSRMRYSKYKS